MGTVSNSIWSSSYSPQDGDHDKVWFHKISDHCDDENPHSRLIHRNTNSPQELEPYKTLHSIWCFNYPIGCKPGQEVGSFLNRCTNNNHKLWFLRVLDLEGVYKPSLPKAIGELINLRYLGLGWTFLDTLPSSVENLRNLQTLDTKHTEIGHYPPIKNMQGLQHLYLNGRHPSELVKQLSYLTDLQTLSGIIVDDSSPVKDGLDKLTKLRKLRLIFRDSIPWKKKAMVEWIGKLESLRTLKLSSNEKQNQWRDSRISLPWPKNKNKQLPRMYLQGQWGSLNEIHDFAPNLTALTLSLTQLDTDPMPILKTLPELKLLRLFSKSFISNRMQCSSKGFFRLRVLKVWKLERLTEWNVEDGALPKLEELEIRSCKSLMSLPNLPDTLRELKLTDMPKKFTSDVKGKEGWKVVIEDW